MSECFMCARLTESATAAEKKADAAVAELAKHDEMYEVKKSRIKEMKRAAVIVLRAAHGFPHPIVLPHIAPRPVPRPGERDRFSLVELE